MKRKNVTLTRTEPTVCPNCYVPLDSISGYGTPSEGDISLCLHCKTFLVIGAKNDLRVLTRKDWRKIPEAFQQRMLAIKDSLPSIEAIKRARNSQNN
jgi:hypothetical protein